MRQSGMLLLVGAVLGAVALLGDLRAAPEDAQVGDVRAVLSRDGVVLRERPSGVAPAQASLPHGAQMRVAETRGRWIRVEVLGEARARGEGGWLRTAETVEPFALTGGGQAFRRQGGARSRPTETEVSAAGRQFDAATEEGYRASRADLGRAYEQLDRIEERVPDPRAVERFIAEGRLGRPEAGR